MTIFNTIGTVFFLTFVTIGACFFFFILFSLLLTVPA